MATQHVNGKFKRKHEHTTPVPCVGVSCSEQCSARSGYAVETLVVVIENKLKLAYEDQSIVCERQCALGTRIVLILIIS